MKGVRLIFEQKIVVEVIFLSLVLQFVSFSLLRIQSTFDRGEKNCLVDSVRYYLLSESSTLHVDLYQSEMSTKGKFILSIIQCQGAIRFIGIQFDLGS